MSAVNEWYKGRNILVTGATGFIGKCLVEKLLRDSQDIGDVYVLIRRKSNVSFEERRDEYRRHIVFKNIADTKPKLLDKLQIIEGDLLSPDLDINATDRAKVIENVSIIFHSAADVRFDRLLDGAFNINVLGTKRMLELACEIKKMDAFVLVSTAFSQTHDIILEEKCYNAPISPLELERYINHFDIETINALTPKLLGKFPNTYGYTKCLGEDLVSRYKDKFPIAIARPPIVITSWKQPFPGYTEGIHGINGWGLAVGRGVLRTMLCQGDYPCNVVQADVTVNAVVVLAYERSQKKSSEPVIFNICEPIGKAMSWNTYLSTLKMTFFSTPFDYAMWLPGGTFKTNIVHHFVCDMLFQYFPALLIDAILWTVGRQPAMLKIQQKIHAGCNVLEYYLNNIFLFRTEKYEEAFSKLNSIDKEIYYDRTKLDFVKYLEVATLGAKIYLVKEKVENLPKARAFMRRLFYLDLFFKVFAVICVTNVVLSYF